MADAGAFLPPPNQSEYAFPAGQGDDDEAAQGEQRNQQIQAAFDAQRFQRGQSQSMARVIASEAAQIAQLRARQAQQKTS
jgi:hypothetical protein